MLVVSWFASLGQCLFYPQKDFQAMWSSPSLISIQDYSIRWEGDDLGPASRDGQEVCVFSTQEECT